MYGKVHTNVLVLLLLAVDTLNVALHDDGGMWYTLVLYINVIVSKTAVRIALIEDNLYMYGKVHTNVLILLLLAACTLSRDRHGVYQFHSYDTHSYSAGVGFFFAIMQIE